MEEATSKFKLKPYMVILFFIIVVLVPVVAEIPFSKLNFQQPPTDSTMLGAPNETDIIFFLFYRLVRVAIFRISLLLFLYFMALLVVYAFRRRLLGPGWLAKSAAIVLGVIIVSYLIFPELASPWLMMLYGPYRFQ